MNSVLDKLPDQLKYEPTIVNSDILNLSSYFIVGGMGGSHLAASLIRDEARLANLSVYSGYGLPLMTEDGGENALFIAVSHSGNTEETLDFAEQALKKGYKLAVITTGGNLRMMAEKNSLPLISIPSQGTIPPRLATGYMAMALLAMMSATAKDQSVKNILQEKLSRLKTLADVLKTIGDDLNDEAGKIASVMKNKIPLVYSSLDDYSLANYLKVSLNETAKMPAFANCYSELNHNELAGFTIADSAKDYCLITIEDVEEDPRILRRMDLTEKLLKEKGATALRLKMRGDDRTERYWRMATLMAHISFALAAARGVDPKDTSFIENFKKELGDLTMRK